ncbi:MAG: TIM barrel protein [Planctomycetota bacterium]
MVSNSKCCYVVVDTNNENYSFQECFELYQRRLQDIAEKFEPTGIKIGLLLRASNAKEADGNFKFIQTAEELLTLVKAVACDNVGVCLDAWEWVVGGGTVDHIVATGISKTVVELRLADLTPGAELDGIKTSQRTQLPGDTEGSFSIELMKAVLADSADFPISVSTDSATYSRGSTDRNVAALSKQLDLLLEGKEPYKVKLEEEAAKAAEADEKENAEQGDKKTPVKSK